MKVKNILCVVLSLVMILTALPLTAINSFATKSGDFEYSIISQAEKTCKITKYSGSANELEIPSIIDGYSVTSIGREAFCNCSSITSIILPDSITDIELFAFCGCSELTSINIPQSVTNIGSSAFCDCSALKAICLSEKLTVLKSSTFENCSSLKSISLPESITSIEGFVFSGCSSLADIIIPDNCTSIGYKAFYDCTSLKDIAIGTGILTVDEQAFNGCRAIENVYIKDLTSWCRIKFNTRSSNPLRYGGSLYVDGKLATNITVPKNVSCIENYVFSGCGSLVNLSLSEGITKIGDYTFSYCSALKSINLPNSIESIGQYAFCGCSSLTNIKIPNSITHLEDYLFYDCASLESISIGNGVTSTGQYVFEGCTSLVNVYISDLASWCNISFDKRNSNPLCYGNCSKSLYLNSILVTDMIIPDGVEYIGEDFFCNCDAVKNITIPKSVERIENFAFGYYYNTDTFEYQKIDGVTIYGYTGTDAERYATENGFKFIDLEKGTKPLGDVNGDNEVTIVDAKWVLQSVANIRKLTAEQKAAADVNGDGNITIVDAKWILQSVAGIRALNK